jgi:hypothetical protein
MRSIAGRWIMGVLGCDLAADPIGRQSCISDVRANAKRGLGCERPALIVVAVEPGNEDDAAARIRQALNEGASGQ